MEKDGRIEQMQLEKHWQACLGTGKADAFVDELRSLGTSVVLDWGFPTQFLNVVQALKDAGVNIWWFYADFGVARRVFSKRGDVPNWLFSKQIAGISSDWHKIEAVFSPNILKTLQDAKTHMDPNEIYDHISVNTTL